MLLSKNNRMRLLTSQSWQTETMFIQCKQSLERREA